MRRVFLLLFALPAAALAQEPGPTASPAPTPTVVVATRPSAAKPADSAPAADLTTAGGQTYRHAQVYRVEPDGITYLYDSGLAKLDFEELPESVRKGYNYDPRVAAAYQLGGEEERRQLDAAAILARCEAARRRQEAIAQEANLAEGVTDRATLATDRLTPPASPAPPQRTAPRRKTK